MTHIVSGDIWAGAEAQAFQLISGLQANGVIKPTVVVFNPGVLFDKLMTLGINVTLADESDLSPLGQIKTICKHLRQSSTDILHTHGFKENVLGTAARYLTGVKRSVQTTHGSPEYQSTWLAPRKKLTQLLDSIMTGFCYDAVVAVSQHLKTVLEPRYPKKTVLIRNFIDTDDIPAAPPEQSEDLPKSDACYKINLVGRCVSVKRMDLFIDTIASLRTDHKLEVEGSICGDGPLLETMKQYAKTKGVAKFIRFRGFVEDLDSEWASMDLLMMPSDHEGLPMTLLEALLRNVPVVAHNAGGIPEVLDHGNSGVLVDNHSATGYASKVAQLIKQPEKARLLAANGQSHVKKEFSKRKNVQKYEALYQAISQKKQRLIQNT
ncbi:glycosyltransferase family 4 protein [Marinobacter changyiensis]|uniref:glycosyltransferase family 4 protein n=1 Tax=Marinobacter changyiensis TaxID=2604091 RepID=UPI0015D0D55A|nr:glycosyltransferase family 4 protein [Marinobacter changyiensis]